MIKGRVSIRTSNILSGNAWGPGLIDTHDSIPVRSVPTGNNKEMQGQIHKLSETMNLVLQQLQEWKLEKSLSESADRSISEQHDQLGYALISSNEVEGQVSGTIGG